MLVFGLCSLEQVLGALSMASRAINTKSHGLLVEHETQVSILIIPRAKRFENKTTGWKITHDSNLIHDMYMTRRSHTFVVCRNDTFEASPHRIVQQASTLQDSLTHCIEKHLNVVL